jgi:2-hydroxy-4-carboxymuconate semialdehyde hemiacetal dehydrogenase
MARSRPRSGWYRVKMRVVMIGCGAVGSIHAAYLAGRPDVELTAVYSPEPQSAIAFAGRFGVRTIATSLEEAVAAADAAIVCSPSAVHFEQARVCLRAGTHTLIELPPCGEPHEAEELGEIARRQGVLVGCAHTSRYLAPYVRIQAAVRSGLLGQIQEISYIRYPQLRPRAWIDNALVHHAAHVIDLAMQWCGGLEPLACTVFPASSYAKSVSLLAALPSGKSLTVAISYGATLPISQMVVLGTKHTLVTDGFSSLRSDMEELQFAGEERTVYEQAIAAQDAQFVSACRGENSYIPWAETENLMRVIHRFQMLAAVRP